MNKLRAASATLVICFTASVAVQAATVPAMIPDSFAVAGSRIKLGDGHSLNLRCSGSGDQVVLFEAGANADSSTWYRVLPLLRDTVRACAYDRAGYGFSDEGPMPRNLDADVADLHGLIRAAKFPLPIVLVGHSLGSNIVRQYATQFPGDVAGVVLVDPPEQGADQSMSEQWKREDVELSKQRDAFLMACEKSAEAGSLNPKCLRPAPSWMGERVAASVTANKSRQSYWRTLRSELASNQQIFSVPVSATETYGDVPLILLSAGKTEEGVPDDVRSALQTARAQTQKRIMDGSSQSKRIDVPDASHDIQLDRPEAVASAVTELLRGEAIHVATKQPSR